MKIGYGFYAHMLHERELHFARQCGATHAVVHLVDYTAGGSQERARKKDHQPVGGLDGWGRAGENRSAWTEEHLYALRQRFETAGLKLAAIENFDPADWHDVLLDGPQKDAQLDYLKALIRTVARAGIRMIGYNFSLAGVASRTTGPFARGGAESVGMTEVDHRPIPNGMVWNMVYNRSAPPGQLAPTTEEALWRRLRTFLEAVLPVAEEEGVVLAGHPDDPPVQRVRQQPRLVWRPELYDRLLDLVPSPCNKLEFCLGTLAEMPGHDLYETLEHYLDRDALGYVHFRNVRGTVPAYVETFIDEGDIDMANVMRIFAKHRYDGVLIPDHTPQMSCDAPWHAGMAYALGYMNALQRTVGMEETM